MAFAKFLRRMTASIPILAPGQYAISEDGTPRALKMGTNNGNVSIPTYADGETLAAIRLFHAELAAAADTDGIHAAVTDTGEPQVITTGITNPAIPRCVTATAGGTAGDIKAIQVIIAGTNYLDEAITETLPAFTADTAGTVIGSKAFKAITSITIPAHDSTGATTAIGWGDKLGLPWELPMNTILYKKTYLDGTVEAAEPTVTVSATAIESNTIDLSSALNAKDVDAYFIV